MSNSRKRRLPIITLGMIVSMGLFALVIGASNLGAQIAVSNTALSGSIYDSSGAAIPGATVTLTNTSQAFARTFITLSDGRYSFLGVPAGSYTLRVEKSGFRPYEQTGIALEVALPAIQDVSLQVGAATQAVTVTASAALLQTSNANESTDLTARQVTELPMNLRNVFAMITTNSMVNQGPEWQTVGGNGNGIQDGDIGFLNFGGGLFGTTAYLLDGHWDNTNDWDGPIFVPGLDEVQEMRIQTNTFTAQYGWSTGNVVNVVTKGGTSHVHGDIWEFLRNDDMDANTFFNNKAGLSKPSFRRNQFGGTVGGPLDIPHVYQQRDKTFFFASYEGNRTSGPGTIVDTLPTADFRNGNFSALLGPTIGTDCLGRTVLSGQIYNPFSTRSVTAGALDPVSGNPASCSGEIRDPFAGNIIPTGSINSVAKNFLQYYPNPTSSGIASNYTVTGPIVVSYDRGNGRIDHNISERQRINFRVSQEHEYKTNGLRAYGLNDPGDTGSLIGENRWDYGMNYVNTINPSTVLTVTGGWNRWNEDSAPYGAGFKDSSVGLPSFLDGISPWFPQVEISGTSGLGCCARSYNPREVRTAAADLTMIRKSHNLTAGFQFISFSSPDVDENDPIFSFGTGMTQGPDPTAANPQTGWGFASFLLGTGNGGKPGTSVPGFNLNAGITQNASSMTLDQWYGAYLQDDWKVSRKLTLNLGIRYDYQAAPTDRFNRYSWFDFTDPNPISTAVGFNVPGHLIYEGGGNGNRRGVWIPQSTNFAPRLGMAYKLTDKLVWRAGFGLFYTRAAQINKLDMYGYSAFTPWVSSVDGITPLNSLSDPFPNGLTPQTGRSQGALTQVGQSVDAWEGYRPTPYVEQWTAGLQYQIAPNTLIEATYLGNRGVKMIFSDLPIDQLNPKYMSMGENLLTPVANPFYNAVVANNLQSECGLNQPTVPQAQLLLRYPQYCGVYDEQTPAGFSTYNALQLTFTHRWSQGLQFVASFTASKFIDNEEGVESWAYPNSGTTLNYYNLAADKSLDGSDIPKSLVLNYIYQLPVGRGKHFGHDMSGVVNAVVGGWQVSGISTFKDGFPLAISASNNAGVGNSGQRPELVGNPNISNPTIQEWFNTAAFAQPAAYTFGNAPRTMPHTRAPGLNTSDVGLEKWWNPTGERLKLEFRAEAYNIANHPNFFAPDMNLGDPTFGTVTNAFVGRSIQFSLKLLW